MAQQFRVQAGDTVSGIAKRFNVPTSAVSGFRSNDPNVIFPDEVLTINTDQGLTPQTPENITPQQPQPQEQQFQIPSVGNVATNFGQQPQQQVQTPTTPPVAEPPIAQQTEQPVVAPTTPETVPEVAPVDDFQVDTTDIEVDEPVEESPIDEEAQQASNFFSQFGVSAEDLGQGFQNNPFGTLSALVDQVMQATGLPDIRDTVTKTANEIEELELVRDKEIQAQQDDPFQSAGTKARRIQQINDKFDKRINARVNKLTLLQDTQKEARQQAQFAATTAINLFDKERQFQQDQLENILDERERVAEAKIDAEERALDEQFKRAGLSLEERRVALAERKAAQEARTGAVGVTGTQIGISPVTGKPFNDSQSKAGTFALRAETAADFFDATDRPVFFGGELLSDIVPERAKSSARKQFEQSAQNFITAILRRESGAAISDDEFVRAERTYIPGPGDDDETLAQKKLARDTVIQGLKNESVGAYEQLKGSVSAGAGNIYTSKTGATYNLPN